MSTSATRTTRAGASAPHRQKGKTLVAGVRNVLGAQKSQIQEWKESLKKITDRKAQASLDSGPAKKLLELESAHEKELRSMNILESPEKRAERIISDIEAQLVQMRGKDSTEGGGGKAGSGKHFFVLRLE